MSRQYLSKYKLMVKLHGETKFALERQAQYTVMSKICIYAQLLFIVFNQKIT